MNSTAEGHGKTRKWLQFEPEDLTQSRKERQGIGLPALIGHLSQQFPVVPRTSPVAVFAALRETLPESSEPARKGMWGKTVRWTRSLTGRDFIMLLFARPTLRALCAFARRDSGAYGGSGGVRGILGLL